jgi:hypothetical protein
MDGAKRCLVRACAADVSVTFAMSGINFSLCAKCVLDHRVQLNDNVATHFSQENIVQHMTNNQLKMGNHRFHRDKVYTYGLPELGKFFLVSHNITLGENASLWPHMTSETKDIEYLSSRTFNGTILFGNFVLMDTAFWQTDRVQDFVATCLQSGGLHRHRCEQFLFMSCTKGFPPQLCSLF